MPRVLAFDVNETLLDLGVLDPLFEEAHGDAALRQQWCSLMLQLAFVGGLTDRYVDFPTWPSTAHCERTIARPRAEVAGYAADPGNTTSWYAKHQGGRLGAALERRAGQSGPGARGRS